MKNIKIPGLAGIATYKCPSCGLKMEQRFPFELVTTDYYGNPTLVAKINWSAEIHITSETDEITSLTINKHKCRELKGE